jgi:hypothetical protein
MNSLTARWVYCAVLLMATACAVLPEKLVASDEAPVAVAPPTPEEQLASIVRERVELAAAYTARHPAMIQTVSAEARLRQAAAAANPEHFHRDLVRALSNELTDALADRRAHPDLARSEAAVSGLLAAINTEMRQRDA